MRVAHVFMLAGASLLVGCSGGGDGGGGTGPDAVFTSISVAPASVNVVVNGTQQLTVTAKDQNGGNMTGLTSTFASSDQSKATVNASGVVTGVAVGTARITVTGTIGTVSKTTNVDVTVAVPGATAAVTATASNQFSPENVTITKGGSVTWTFNGQHTVTFDASGSPANIERSSGSEARTFPNAGTFAYHCTIHAGMDGSVVVLP